MRARKFFSRVDNPRELVFISGANLDARSPGLAITVEQLLRFDQII